MILPTLAKKNLLLMAAPPSPNGQLHLGHIGGPFLKLDIIARHYKQNECTAIMVSGNDCYDSYVLLKALKENQSPSITTKHYHNLIYRDLKNMDIAIDDFIDPYERINEYSAYSHLLNDALIKNADCVSRSEKFPYCEALSGFLPESFMTGNCPSCNHTVGGLTCEKCSMHFLPEDILNLKSKIPSHQVDLREVTNYFLQFNPQEIVHYHHARQTNSKSIELIKRYFSSGNNRSRLTISGNWGVKTNHPDQIYYSLATIFSYCLMQGAVYASLTNSELNAFDKDSNVTTVVSFGIDNSIVYLVDTAAIVLSQERYKGFDQYLINEFFTLNGDKFSTSRGSAIWVQDIIEKHQVSSDILRLYLALNNSDEDAGDFNTTSFAEFYNTMIATFKKISAKCQKLEDLKPTALPEIIYNQFVQALTTKNTLLAYDNYKVKPYCEMILNWLTLMETETNNNMLYWYLKCFATLSYPLMPKISRHIWQALGEVGFPKIDSCLMIPNSLRIDVHDILNYTKKLTNLVNFS